MRKHKWHLEGAPPPPDDADHHQQQQQQQPGSSAAAPKVGPKQQQKQRPSSGQGKAPSAAAGDKAAAAAAGHGPSKGDKPVAVKAEGADPTSAAAAAAASGSAALPAVPEGFKPPASGIVGRRIKCYWPEEDAWFYGRVMVSVKCSLPGCQTCPAALPISNPFTHLTCAQPPGCVLMQSCVWFLPTTLSLVVDAITTLGRNNDLLLCFSPHHAPLAHPRAGLLQSVPQAHGAVRRRHT
jgi:hypothetical protein